MEAYFAIELGADDEVLDLPWASADSAVRYYDLKRQPDLLIYVKEAQRLAALEEFLTAINSSVSVLETAKCDAWHTTEMQPEEEIFGANSKFASYIDLLFSDDVRRFSFSGHEQMAARLAQLLRRVPEIPAAAEFLVRRCHYHHEDETRDGFYITFYLFGYGDDEPQAQQRWAIGLKLVENAIRQISAAS